MPHDDPIRVLIDKLDTIEAEVSTLSAQVSTAPIGRPVTAEKIEEAIERGTMAGARSLAEPVSALHSMAQALDRAAKGLIEATAPAKQAVQAQTGLSRWKATAIVLTVLLCLSVAFLGGVYSTRSGLLLTTEAGCGYLGGTWSKKQTEPGYVCWVAD